MVWVCQEPVRHSVECVTSGKYSPIDDGEFGDGDNTRRILEGPRFHRDAPSAQLRLIVRRGASDNPIEVFGSIRDARLSHDAASRVCPCIISARRSAHDPPIIVFITRPPKF